MSSADQSPTDYKGRLADRLNELLEDRGKKRADLVRVLACSESKVGKILRGEVSVSRLELIAVLDALDVHGEDRADLEHLGEAARRRRPKTPWGAAIPDRLRKFFNTEETARVVESYRPDLLHGLVQTPAYARAVLRTNSSLRAADVEHLVQARMARQARLNSPNPPEFTLVILDRVLRNDVGGSEVMAEQLRYLAEIAARPHVTVRVIPEEVGLTDALFFPFTVLTPPGARPKTVYVETLTDGLFVDEESRVAHYELVFARVLEAALSAEETLARLDSVISQP
ncbi:helix-turn-helix domain-containing protein [Lentzea chajnantorensis]